MVVLCRSGGLGGQLLLKPLSSEVTRSDAQEAGDRKKEDAWYVPEDRDELSSCSAAILRLPSSGTVLVS